MTELETLQRAKTYIDKLANGVNPLTNLPAEDDDIVNNVRISRCLFYVSEVLCQVIENSGGVGAAPKKPKKLPFRISQEQLEAYIPTSAAIPVSAFVERINELVLTDTDVEQMTKLRYTAVTTWLIEEGLLEETVDNLGKKTKRPTQQGREIGILTEERIGQYGPYTVVLCSKGAQQFIIDNFDAVLQRASEKSL